MVGKGIKSSHSAKLLLNAVTIEHIQLKYSDWQFGDTAPGNGDEVHHFLDALEMLDPGVSEGSDIAFPEAQKGGVGEVIVH